MLVMGVEDVESWHQHVRKVVSTGEFQSVRIKAPETVGNSLVLHVGDPSGVLLLFVQYAPAISWCLTIYSSRNLVIIANDSAQS